MKVKVLAFGIAKDILGSRSLEINLPKETSVTGLKEHLIKQFPDFAKLRSLHLAINQEYVQDSMVIKNNDEIVIIPPVSGG